MRCQDDHQRSQKHGTEYDEDHGQIFVFAENFFRQQLRKVNHSYVSDIDNVLSCHALMCDTSPDSFMYFKSVHIETGSSLDN